MAPQSTSLRQFGASEPNGYPGRRSPVTPSGEPRTNREAAFEQGVTEMHALLDRMRPSSDAEALSALRNAFPGTSLAARVAAISQRITG